MTSLPSYRPYLEVYDCYCLGTENQPCWGRVEHVDTYDVDSEDGEVRVYACEGHRDLHSCGLPYYPEPTAV